MVHRDTLSFFRVLKPIAGKSHRWVMVETPKPQDASAAVVPKELQKYERLRTLDIKYGQPLCEVICVRVEDKNGNIVPLREHHTTYVPLVWPWALTRMWPKLVFGILFNTMHGLISFFLILPVQKVQLIPGLPYCVHLQLKGFPNEFLDTSEDKDDGASSCHARKTLPAHLSECASESETSSTEDSKGSEG